MSDFRSHSLSEDTEKVSLREKLKNRFFRKKTEAKWKYSVRNIFLGGAAFVFLAGGIFTIWLLSDIPNAKELQNLVLAESSAVYDSTGEVVLYNIHGEENRRYVPLEEISPHMATAILASEDADFYNHPGVDFAGMMRSVYFLAITGDIKGGGSTLTQQVARNTLLTLDRTIIRKLKEIYLAFRIENNFSKDRILELYLNKVSFGNNAFGIEQAARTYFGKSARSLTLAESIVLAGIPQAPTRWSPYGPNKISTLDVTPEILAEKNITTAEEFWDLKTDEFSPTNTGLIGADIEINPEVTIYAEGRADYVLNQMREKGFISELEYDKTKEDLKTLTFIPYRAEIKAPHFVFYVRQLLEEQLEENALEQSGLKIITTLDVDLQEKAEELATKNAAANDSYGISNIALVAAEPATGYIRAMVGSRDYWSEEETDGKVNIILQKRQPGSSFKPIAYAAGFLKGLAPATVLMDVETRFGQTTPQNFDGRFRGPVSLRQALGNSLNIPAVKVGIIAGNTMYDLAQKMGLALQYDAEFYGSSLAIGSGETRPLDMLQAYTIFANQGKKIPLNPILWVEDRDGNILLDYREPIVNPEEVMDAQTAYSITHILSDASSRGPGWNSRLQLSGRTNAVKTGTSNAVDPVTNAKYPNDTWTIGYTPQLATAVWAGNNRGYIKNNRASGWQNAALYWKEFMEYAHQGKAAEQFARAEGMKTIAVDRFSGKLPAEGFPVEFIVQDIFTSKNAPTTVGDSLQFVKVDRVSGKLPTALTPPDAIENRAVINFHSYFPENPAWEAPVQRWVENFGAEFIAAFGAKNFLSKIPTESDDVHTAEAAAEKPQVSILSPLNFGIVTPPYVDVFPDISAPNSIRAIEFYWDDELKTTITRAPWRGTIQIGAARQGSTHTLKVRVIDRLYYADESSVSVKIGEDEDAPEVSFIFPTEGQSIAAGALHTFQISAQDSRSSVKQAEFLIDGKRIGTATEAPFAVSWNAPDENETYEMTVKVSDTAGNSTQQRITFSTTKNNGGGNQFGITNPAGGSTVSSPVALSASILPEHARSFESLEIWVKKSDGFPAVIHSFSGSVPPNRTFTTIWDAQSGNYQVWVNVSLSSGGSQISQKTTLTVE